MSTFRPSEREPLLRVIPPVPEEDASSFGSTESHGACIGEEERSRPPAPPRGVGGSTTKILAALFSFLVLGLIMSTPGVILPHLAEHYHLDDIHASLVFLVAPAGYLVGAWLNDPIHRHLGQRGIAVLAPVCQIVFTATVATFHDARKGGGGAGFGFPLFLAATVVGNVGSGLIDGSWCAWAGGLGGGREGGGGGGERTNTVQGLLHGSFSIGAGLGPFLAGTMFTMLQAPWWTWYYVLLCAVVVQALILTVAFRAEDGSRYRTGLHDDRSKKRDESDEGEEEEEEEEHSMRGVMQRRQRRRRRGLIFRHRVTWICAAYFLAYVGTEAAISGWVVTFMLRARHASPYLASLSSSCFWMGMAAGRFTLGVVTDKVIGSLRWATAAYLAAAILAQAGLLLLPFAAAVPSVVLVGVVGFFLGPLFPSGIVAIARLLPRDLHVGAVSFVASVGQLGAALLPFALGSLAQWVGIRVFQVFILAMIAVTLLLWLLFPPVSTSPPPVRQARDGN